MKEHDTDDVRPFGGIDVGTLQRYLNFHYSVSLDLFGAETSTNAANYFAAGLKGRFKEEAARRRPSVERRRCGTVPAGDRRRHRRARGTGAGGAQRDAARRLRRRLPQGRRSLEPHAGRRRARADAAARRVQPRRRHVRGPTGQPGRPAPGEGEWTAARRRVAAVATTTASYVESLMVGVASPGKMAGWVAPPSAGIHAKPVDFEYVK